MKNKFSLILLVGCSLLFTACKKEQTVHTITYKYRMLDFSNYGIVQNISVGVSPRYMEPEYIPSIKDILVNDWEYTYIGLKDGDQVYFEIQIPLSIYFEQSIFVDNKEVSYRKIKMSSSNYYSGYVVESRGMDTITGFHYLPGAINFTFHE